MKHQTILSIVAMIFFSFSVCLIWSYCTNRPLALSMEEAPIAGCRGAWLSIEDGVLKVWGEYGPEGFLSYEQRETIFEDNPVSVWDGGFCILVLDGNGDLWIDRAIEGAFRKDNWWHVLSHVVSARGGLWNYIALCSDGSLWIWGHNDHGQLGNGEMGEGSKDYPPVRVMDHVCSADIMDETIFAVTSDGTLYGIGAWNHWSQPICIARHAQSVFAWQVLMEDGTLQQIVFPHKDEIPTLKDTGVSNVTNLLPGNVLQDFDGNFYLTERDSFSSAIRKKFSLGKDIQFSARNLDGLLIQKTDGQLQMVDIEDDILQWKNVSRAFG